MAILQPPLHSSACSNLLNGNLQQLAPNYLQQPSIAQAVSNNSTTKFSNLQTIHSNLGQPKPSASFSNLGTASFSNFLEAISRNRQPLKLLATFSHLFYGKLQQPSTHLQQPSINVEIACVCEYLVHDTWFMELR